MDVLARRTRIVESLERVLEAAYVDDLASGHTGATIMRFRLHQDGRLLVAKCCLSEDATEALADIRANIQGYAAMHAIGADAFVPPEYTVHRINGCPVLTMRYLGESFRTRVEQGENDGYLDLCEHLGRVVPRALRRDAAGERSRHGVEAVIAAIQRYAAPLATLVGPNAIAMFFARVPTLPSASVALMLLDCTPDNVFVDAKRCTVIDPWEQATYLGNPAVSIGQFVTLARDVYALRGAKKGGKLLEGFVTDELPGLLGCTPDTAAHAFQLGAALQFVCSAYVRRTSDPQTARVYLSRATAAYTAALGGVP
ncbi:MAG: hypothetical protein Q7S02_05945 [bacterium]|nr:hypothetical protein [bacterium]